MPAARADTPADRAAWERLVSTLMDVKPALGAVLQHGAPVEVTPARIALAFPPGSFFGQQAEALDARRAIADAAERVFGARPEVEVVYSEEALASAKTLAQEGDERRRARRAATQERALSHPLVVEVAQLFDLPRERMTVRVELE